MTLTFAEKVIRFHQELQLSATLPNNIKVMNPYQNQPEVMKILEEFCTTFFQDNRTRKLIVGINPGRLGAGMTGIPFTDTKRLTIDCKLTPPSFETHEPSSVFVYDVINAYGGPTSFYKHFYINSVCPLGFIQKNRKEHWVNCNYYDDPKLFKAVKPFILASLQQQIAMGIDTRVCFSLGKKNARFLAEINAEEKLFEKIIALPHPRYVMQYKFKTKTQFVAEYLKELRK